MTTSETVADLAAAMAKAQGEMEHASKDNVNPHFGSKYADLASINRACRPALSKHEIAVFQALSSTAGLVIVTTRLIHASGEWISADFSVPVAQSTAQALGSAATYARRYSLAAMVGVAPDDDDGEAADPRARPAPVPPPARKPAPRPAPEPTAIKPPTKQPLWDTREDMEREFLLMGSVIGTQTYTKILAEHQIPINLQWDLGKRPPRLLEAYKILKDLLPKPEAS